MLATKQKQQQQRQQQKQQKTGYKTKWETIFSHFRTHKNTAKTNRANVKLVMHSIQILRKRFVSVAKSISILMILLLKILSRKSLKTLN